MSKSFEHPIRDKKQNNISFNTYEIKISFCIILPIKSALSSIALIDNNPTLQ